MTKQEIINLASALYGWFNQISEAKAPFRQKDLEIYFTPDFIMQLNDEIITYDYDSLFTHFEEFRKSGYKLEARLPLQEIIVSDDHRKCAARYIITKTSAALEKSEIKVMAIWHLSTDGRMQRMNEVVHFPPVVQRG